MAAHSPLGQPFVYEDQRQEAENAAKVAGENLAKAEKKLAEVRLAEVRLAERRLALASFADWKLAEARFWLRKLMAT